MAIGSLDFQFRNKIFLEKEIHNHNLVFRGTVKDIKTNTNGDRLLVDVNSVYDSLGNEIRQRNLKLFVRTDGILSSVGEIIEFRGKPIKITSSKSNTYTSQLIHKGYQYLVNLRFKDVRHLGISNSLMYEISRFRENLAITLENSSLNRNTTEFLTSILLGDKSLLRSDTRQILTSAGMAHILALSGMHVAIVYSLFLALLFPLSFFGFRKTRQILALSFIWLFVLLTGGAPSTIRAAIMLTIVMGAFILERKNSVLNALLFAVFIILLLNPENLWDVGLQLSFFCVLAIILLVPKLNLIDHRSHPLLHKSCNILLVTIVTTVFTCGLTSYYFGNLPLMFILSNFILLPLLPLFIGAGAVYLILLGMGLDFHFLAGGLDLFIEYFIIAADTMSLGNSAVISVEINLITMILYTSALLLIAYALNTSFKKSRKIMSYFAAGLLIISVGLAISQNLSSNSVDTLRFNHSFTKFEVKTSRGEKIQYLDFPRRTISSHHNGSFNIYAIDATVKEGFIEELFNSFKDDINFLFVGPDADFYQITSLIESGIFHKVILHSGVGEKKKSQLLDLVTEINRDKIYSLRDNGSLEFRL